MPSKDMTIVHGAVEFAAQFGFLTRDIFFEFLCPRTRARQYDYWHFLKESGAFVPSRRDENVYYLSKHNTDPSLERTKRKYFYHIDHDSIVARVMLSIKGLHGLTRCWTETQLRTDTLEAIQILGSSDLRKLPDLVVDVPSTGGTRRVAFEIEATAKSRERYRQAAFSYLSMANVDAVVYVCNGLAIERTVDASFAGEIFVARNKVPALLQLRDFELHGIEARVRYLESEMPLLRFLIANSQDLNAVAS